VGKSSLVRAGVIPQLKRSGEGWDARAAAVAELIRTALDAADRPDPADRDRIYAALVAELRLRRWAKVRTSHLPDSKYD